MKSLKPLLLIEDDAVDVMTVQRAIKHLHIDNHLVHLKDGKDALEYLRNETNTKPCIIILDLNAPRMSGIELLEIIKVDEILKSIPIIVMSTSDTKKDIEACFSLSVAGYIVKPIDFNRFVEALGTIHEYWYLSELPSDR